MADKIVKKTILEEETITNEDQQNSILSSLFSDANLINCIQDRERQRLRRIANANADITEGKLTDKIQTRMYRSLYSRTSTKKICEAQNIMDNYGFVILEKKKAPLVISAKLLQLMKRVAIDIESTITTRLKNIGIDVLESSRKRKRLALNGQMQSFKFAEVSSRCYGRLDVRYGMDQAPFNDPKIVTNPPWLPLIYSLLGTDAQLKYCGLILSFPGSIDQPFHGDGIHLFGNKLQCPMHACNVFIPLCDISRELGPTEFIPGSHLLSTAAVLNDNISKTSSNIKNHVSSIAPLLSEGTVMLYDFRTIHRGTANTHPSQCRHMFYMLYAKPWFTETINFGSTSVFSDDATAADAGIVGGEDINSAGYRDFENL